MATLFSFLATTIFFSLMIIRIVKPEPPPCQHLGTVPVTLTSGETVARLCMRCDTQLPS